MFTAAEFSLKMAGTLGMLTAAKACDSNRSLVVACDSNRSLLAQVS